jgi:hypothetical protein
LNSAAITRTLDSGSTFSDTTNDARLRRPKVSLGAPGSFYVEA